MRFRPSHFSRAIQVKNLDTRRRPRHTTRMAIVELTPEAAQQAERLPKAIHPARAGPGQALGKLAGS